MVAAATPPAEPAPGGWAGRPTPAGRCDHGGMVRLSDAFIDDRAPANTNRGAGWRAAARGRTQAAGATTWLSGAGCDGAAVRGVHRRPSCRPDIVHVINDRVPTTRPDQEDDTTCPSP